MSEPVNENSLKETISELNKRFGKNTIISGDELKALDLKRVSSGSLALDIETGGGFPYGRVVELFGNESTGKSFIAAKTAAEVQKDKRQVMWIDVEGSFDASWAKLCGVEVSKIHLARPDTGEMACDILDASIRSGDCGLIVLDSTAALIPAHDVDISMGDVEQLGTRAKMVNRLIRKLHAALNLRVGEDRVLNDCLVIFINQIREKIGVMWGNPEVTPGGKGLKFAAAIRLEFRKKWLKDPNNEDNVIGQTVNFVTVKNKTYPPYRHGSFDFYTDGELRGQIDLASEVLTYGMLLELINHSGKSYTIGNEKIVGQEAALNYLRSNKKLVLDLRDKIIKKGLSK